MKRSEEREQAFILVFEKIFNSELSSQDIKDIAVESELFTAGGFAEKLFDTRKIFDQYLQAFLKVQNSFKSGDEDKI